MSSTTIQDVADKAGVSITTVSRVLNNDSHKVSAQTRERVLSAARLLSYYPNALAKGLLRRQTMTIGVIIPDISNPYYAEIVRGIQDDADENGYMIIIENTDRRDDQLLRSLSLLQQKVADGLIIAGGHEPNRKTRRSLMEYRDRLVLIGRQEIDLPSIRIDNVGGAREAMEYLHGIGHSRIGFISGPGRFTTMSDRLLGYRTSVRHTMLLQVGDLTPESGYLAANKLLQSPNRPTAILTANDQMAFGVYKAIREHGLRIPEDVSVMGFDNVPLSLYTDPPMTTMDIPRYLLGSNAMSMMRSRLKDEMNEEIRTFRMKLLLRQSTAPPGLPSAVPPQTILPCGPL